MPETANKLKLVYITPALYMAGGQSKYWLRRALDLLICQEGIRISKETTTVQKSIDKRVDAHSS